MMAKAYSEDLWRRLPASHAAIGDALANILDPIHSYFLHPGLVRKSRDPRGVNVDFRKDATSAFARYTETRKRMTLLQRA